MGGDIVALAIHFVVWTSILILIEVGAINWIWNALICNKDAIKPRDNLDLDEDVLNEERRVEETSKDQMKVRVNKFRKVYNTGFSKPYCAVERTSFGLDYGECFALFAETPFLKLSGD